MRVSHRTPGTQMHPWARGARVSCNRSQAMATVSAARAHHRHPAGCDTFRLPAHQHPPVRYAFRREGAPPPPSTARGVDGDLLHPPSRLDPARGHGMYLMARFGRRTTSRLQAGALRHDIRGGRLPPSGAAPLVAARGVGYALGRVTTFLDELRNLLRAADAGRAGDGRSRLDAALAWRHWIDAYAPAESVGNKKLLEVPPPQREIRARVLRIVERELEGGLAASADAATLQRYAHTVIDLLVDAPTEPLPHAVEQELKIIAARTTKHLNHVQLGKWCFRNETQAGQGRAAKLY